jgi:hypothetical protein
MSQHTSIARMLNLHSAGLEVFTLDEGRVTIIFPAKLSGASLDDLRQYLDIFYRKACRLTDEPADRPDGEQLAQLSKDEVRS